MAGIFDPWVHKLAERRHEVQPALDAFLRRVDVQPVGTGYIDIITPTLLCEEFVAKVTDLHIPIERITLWCHCTEENRVRYGCPHGFGGPPCDGGFYSELCERDSFEPSLPAACAMSEDHMLAILRDCNRQALEFVRVGMRGRSDYSPCLVPGFWLAVPEEWRSDGADPDEN